MVRPIEINDSIAKTEVVERIQQQNTRLLPEAAQHYKRTQIDKMMEKVTTPSPVEIQDMVILHSDVKDKEKEKKKENADKKDSILENQDNTIDKNDNANNNQNHEHIDFRI